MHPYYEVGAYVSFSVIKRQRVNKMEVVYFL